MKSLTTGLDSQLVAQFFRVYDDVRQIIERNRDQVQQEMGKKFDGCGLIGDEGTAFLEVAAELERAWRPYSHGIPSRIDMQDDIFARLLVTGSAAQNEVIQRAGDMFEGNESAAQIKAIHSLKHELLNQYGNVLNGFKQLRSRFQKHMASEISVKF